MTAKQIINAEGKGRHIFVFYPLHARSAIGKQRAAKGLNRVRQHISHHLSGKEPTQRFASPNLRRTASQSSVARSSKASLFTSAPQIKKAFGSTSCRSNRDLDAERESTSSQSQSARMLAHERCMRAAKVQANHRFGRGGEINTEFQS